MKLNPKALTGSLVLAGLMFAGTAQAGAVITNGTVTLGVNDLGHLNTPWPAGSSDPLGIGYVGLRYNTTGAASTEPGCLCEGWGVALVSSGIKGYANEASGTAGLSLVSFNSTASTAVSVVNVGAATAGPALQVTHNYQPIAGTPNLYQVAVTIKNLTGNAIAAGDLRYRRVMDWDIYPTPFSEYVTIQGVPAALGIANGSNVYRTDNNGFNSSDPTSFSSYGLQDQNFTDSGPADHGALFDFEFAALAADGEFTFYTYYGAASSEADADMARRLVDGDASDVDIGLYSYGQPSTANGPSLGEPNTFIFGFGVSGGVFVDPDPNPTPEPGSLALLGLGFAGLAAMRRRKSK